jgi:RHS repeat-associated protein
VTGGSVLATYVYGYDNADRVTAETDKEGTASFTYDNADELTGVTGSRPESYSYDLNGNRNATGYTTGTENELTASPGVTYSYDNAGNMTGSTKTSTHVTMAYSYDYRNRLTGVTVGGTATATYVYDALDRRIGIKASGAQTWTTYDGKNPYADFNGSGTLLTRYLAGRGVVNGAVADELLARTSSGGTTAWYLPDKLDTVRDLVGSSGTLLDHVVYDSFGNIVTETSATNGDRFKYAGMEYDAVTGIFYDRARWYDPGAGRFLSQDPLDFLGGDCNLFRYVYADPTNLTDPSGQAPPKGGTPIGPIGPNDPSIALLEKYQEQISGEREADYKRMLALIKLSAENNKVFWYNMSIHTRAEWRDKENGMVKINQTRADYFTHKNSNQSMSDAQRRQLYAALALLHEGMHMVDELDYGSGSSLHEEARVYWMELELYRLFKQDFHYVDEFLETRMRAQLESWQAFYDSIRKDNRYYPMGRNNYTYPGVITFDYGDSTYQFHYRR